MRLVFGDPESIAIRDKARKQRTGGLPRMHAAYGVTPSATCRSCKWFLREGHHDRTYSKCQKYKMTRGRGSDWNGKWQACGLFDSDATLRAGELEGRR